MKMFTSYIELIETFDCIALDHHGRDKHRFTFEDKKLNIEKKKTVLRNWIVIIVITLCIYNIVMTLL